MKATGVDRFAGRTGRAAVLACALPVAVLAPSGAPESPVLVGRLELDLDLEVVHASTRVTCEHGDEVRGGSTRTATAEKGENAELHWRAAWEDTNRVLSGRRLTGFVRNYVDLELDLDRGGPRGALSLASPLEGTPHRWTWKEGAGYDRSFLTDPEVATAKALRTLESDLSYSWIVPAGGFSEAGQVWYLEAGDLIESLWPGGFGAPGSLGYDVSDGECPEELPMVHVAVVPSIPPDALAWPGTLDGEVRAELQDVEGGRVAVIALQFHVDTSITVEDWFGLVLHGEEDWWTDSTEWMHYSGEGLTVAIRGSGTARWSIAQGHLVSVELTGEVEMESDLRWSYSWDAPQIEQFFGERSETWRGQFELAGAVEQRK